ncbi:MAG: DNA repair protein RecN [Legionellales bacterium]|nr:DNA repair protein RecN [Legionellales bacterium]
MLKQLDIENFTLIDRVSLEFHSGLTALTGETGAGKSILIDALNLTLGSRAESSLIKKPNTRASISAIFHLDDPHHPALQWLIEHSMDAQQDCILRRVLYKEGRSAAFINGHACTLLEIRQLGDLLLTIHGQHEHHALLSRDYQRQLLDAYANNHQLLQQIKTLYQQWQVTQKKLEQLSHPKQSHSERKALLTYQIAELEQLNLQENEIDTLSEQQQRLSQAETIQWVYQALLDEIKLADEDAMIPRLHALQQKLKSLNLAETQSIHDYLQNAIIQLTEGADEIKILLENIIADPENLRHIEQRLDKIYEVARKHHIKPPELSNYFNDLSQELDKLNQNEHLILQLQKELHHYVEHYRVLAKELHQSRVRAAEKFKHAVSEIIHTLGMPHCQFSVAIKSMDVAELHAFGSDEIDFIVQTNPDQEPQLLNKIASGGELSRMSLAIDVATANVQAIPTLIFDEVDSGIGGRIAAVVGKLLHQLSQHKQVLNVTHLPQIAAKAHQHIRVSKITHEGKTTTQADYLAANDRVHEIARMLGSEEITQQTLAHAEEMLEIT